MLESYMTEHLPPGAAEKVAVVDVGPDRWGHSLDADLLSLLAETPAVQSLLLEAAA